MHPSTFLLIISMMIISGHTLAQEVKQCQVEDHACLFSIIETEAESMTESRWRNQAYRDLAVSYIMEGKINSAVGLVDKIDNPDTQAMTIRAMGMAVALHQDLDDAQYRVIFQKLDEKAATIKDEGAKDVAYTYIAMAQAFAELDDDATKTTENMTNPALKHKAFGETAEIQAERGEYDLAMQSINAIDSIAFKNKALGIVSGIFVKKEQYDRALSTAMQITNSAKKISAIQKIIDARQGTDKRS
jgi:hypothetical protein